MGTTPFSSIVGGIGSLIFGTLAKYRLLWFLHEDTMLQGGRQVPSAEFAAFLAKFLYIGGTVLIIFAVVLLMMLSEEYKRRIAQLPRWQRFLVWPIDRHIAPKDAR